MSNLRVGSIIEVECDRYWCIAEILEVLENGSYKVKYEGWDSSYDEIVTFDRMAPLGTGVYKYKAWVKLNKNDGFWPCVLSARYTKTEGDKDPEDFFKNEKRMYIKPAGDCHHMIKPYYSGGK